MGFELIGYLIVLLPVIIILYAVVFCKNIGNVPSAPEERALSVNQEGFFDFSSVGRTVIDRFESMFFSPEIAAAEGVAVGPASVSELKKGEDEDVPGAVNLTADGSAGTQGVANVPGAVNLTAAVNLTGKPDICESTNPNCKQAPVIRGSPLPPVSSLKPYGDGPIGQLDETGMRGLAEYIGDLQADRAKPTLQPAAAIRAAPLEVGKPNGDKRYNSQCRLLPSGLEPPAGYEAAGTIAISGAKLKCGGKQPERVCSAVARVKNGEVDEIIVVDGGRGYEDAPEVVLKGNGGSGCKAVAFIDDAGVVKVIEVLSGGAGYKSTPDVVFKTSEETDSCQLWCKAS